MRDDRVGSSSCCCATPPRGSARRRRLWPETVVDIANASMGHVDESMGEIYRERIHDARLRTVVEHTRNWLFSAVEAPHDAGGQSAPKTRFHVSAG